jgi:alpha-beta hydrolase superfamily lysophospholipase
MVVCSSLTYPSADGSSVIHAQRWTPEDGVRGIVQIAHGIAEHIGRYDRFARFLAEHGLLAVGNDHAGHGESAEALGVWGETAAWTLAVEDMRRLYELTREDYPSVPYFLFGHSMGSFLSRTYVIRYPRDMRGLILSGTGQQSKALLKAAQHVAGAEIRTVGWAGKSKRLFKLIFSGYNKAFSPVRTPMDWLTRDDKEVDAYLADPLCGFLPSAGMLRDMLEGIGYVSDIRNIRRMDAALPVLFMSGDADPVGENGKGVVRAYRSFLDVGMEDVSLHLVHGARHELINEINRDEIFREALFWINSKL